MDAEGRILSVGLFEQGDNTPYTEFYAGALLPGLVNCHCHLELSYLEGQIPPGEGFAAFAQAMGRVRHRFSDEERQAAMVRADSAMQREGVVAVGDVANGVTAYPVKAQSAIHYHTFAELFGLRSSDSSAVAPLMEYPATTMTPHSLYSVQDALFGQICREGEGPLSIHFLESEGEKGLYEGWGHLWEWYREVGFECDFLHYGSPTERLIRSVPRDRALLLIHNCLATEEDVRGIMEHFTAPVSWVLCPGSNDYISHQKPPVELLRRLGVSICLGTDSLASNHALSMLDELRRLEGVPLDERLQWATLNGARALGLDDELGSVEVGKRPGLLLLEGADWQRMELTPHSRLRRIA